MLCSPNRRWSSAHEAMLALDVSVQATVLELLSELRDERGPLALVFVTHDLGVLRAIADDAIVMQTGVVCERGKTDLCPLVAAPAPLHAPVARRRARPGAASLFCRL